jgi:membrane-bound ClpP family serine protease
MFAAAAMSMSSVSVLANALRLKRIRNEELGIGNLKRQHDETENNGLIGKIAVTETELRPLGAVSIDNEVYEARAEEDFIDADRGVRVTRVRGKTIFVRRV